ncbi:MAG: HD domain-containing protein [Proteobacteria bacterium]|nr:HD domain-containing protein [Pseudomonadota bacterium]MBU1716337.1 HD domain-containing protein [Pseudomonadota bacterium]
MSIDYSADPQLLEMRDQLDAKEKDRLSSLAAFSCDGLRRKRLPEEETGHRQSFALDADRIMHSRAYTRYIDKTQVFYMVRNDHITHRVLHVQLVSKIGRTIGRFLGLNEDLIEAIALGHDIGHPPFGHDGEKELNALCVKHGLPSFQHNIQSVLFLDQIEKKGRGWNLTLQTLDGIMCHDGEIHSHALRPRRDKNFADFDRELAEKSRHPFTALVPMTLEGCVVRFSDTIAYIGRDIEDAIELKLIKRQELPVDCQKILGNSNGKIVYTLVEDLIKNGIKGDMVFFSPEISEGLKRLKAFNYERIYCNPAIKQGLDLIKKCYQVLFETYLEKIEKADYGSAKLVDFFDGFSAFYLENTPAAAKVRDFMAGMTDDYFLSQARLIGCEVPERL